MSDWLNKLHQFEGGIYQTKPFRTSLPSPCRGISIRNSSEKSKLVREKVLSTISAPGGYKPGNEGTVKSQSEKNEKKSRNVYQVNIRFRAEEVESSP